MLINRVEWWKKPVTLVVLVFACGIAVAHIKNEASQFPDIEFSDARFDIVVLVGAGIVPETPVFEPEKPLSKREVASWAALARGLAPGGETPDTDALAIAARDEGIVDSLQGNATYSDLNMLFFGDQLTVEDPGKIPNKAEAARFIAGSLDTESGRQLLRRRGLRAGVRGEVTSVESQRDDHGGNTYMIKVGDVSRQMHEHGRVANGPTDLLQWQGRSVRRSFISGEGDEVVWIYLEAEPLPRVEGQATSAAEEVVDVQKKDRRLLYGLSVAVVVLGLALFLRRRRSR